MAIPTLFPVVGPRGVLRRKGEDDAVDGFRAVRIRRRLHPELRTMEFRTFIRMPGPASGPTSFFLLRR